MDQFPWHRSILLLRAATPSDLRGVQVLPLRKVATQVCMYGNSISIHIHPLLPTVTHQGRPVRHRLPGMEAAGDGGRGRVLGTASRPASRIGLCISSLYPLRPLAQHGSPDADAPCSLLGSREMPRAVEVPSDFLHVGARQRTYLQACVNHAATQYLKYLQQVL